MVEVPVDMTTLNQCVTQASQTFNIHPIIIKSLISVEGGQVGTLSRNSNGSHDMGVMQINTIHEPEIKAKFGYSAKDLITDPCKNIMAGTWILWQRIQESPKMLWVAVGNYHSKTPWYRHNYLKKVEQAYSRLLPVFGKDGEAKAIGRTTNWGNATTLAQASPMAFPSIKELEAIVAQGGGLPANSASSPSSASSRHRAAPPKRPQRTTNVVSINNTKRKVLRFID